MKPLEYYQNKMIDTIKSYGCRNNYIFEAMRQVPRHLFLDPDVPMETVYADSPQPIGDAQTISQPYTVAYMLDLLELGRGLRVLEIGTGSGWNAALIKELVGEMGEVISLEINEFLAQQAKLLLYDLKIEVDVRHYDGSLNLQKDPPFDRIIVTCAAPKIYSAWIDQLADGGIIVAPVGIYSQRMIKGKKHGNDLKVKKYGSFMFVPMLFFKKSG